MTDFDAKAARAKRPLPLWVDALVRDTALLETDEFGAYIKILMAMWVSRNVAIPDEPRKMARASGVSLRLWNCRVGPALSGFWSACPEGLTQKRLREEAAYTERQVTYQSNRKRAENPGNVLKNNNPTSTTDTPTDTPTDQPTQLPNIRDDDDDAGARVRISDHDSEEQADSCTVREQILGAMGLDNSGVMATRRIVGRMADMHEFHRWQDDLGLSLDEVLAVIGEVMDRKRKGLDREPPVTFSYFTNAMRHFASETKQKPALKPIEGGRTDDRRGNNQSASRAKDPHARALGGVVESFGRVIAAQRTGGTDDP